MPRNRKAAARGARIRETIRQLMLEHAERNPLARPLPGKTLQAMLADQGVRLALSTVLWHVSRVRLAADLDALEAGGVNGEKPSNLSAASGPVI